MTTIGRRAALMLVALAVLGGGIAGAESPAAKGGRRYLIHVSGMT